nr:tyrosine-type recombinase/integrase [Roseateles albus]
MANKIGIAKTLLGRFILSKEAHQALQDESPKIKKGTTGSACRDGLTKEQLTLLLATVFNDRSLPADDRVAVALHALSGTRLEEICAMDACRINWSGEYWLLDIIERGVSLTKTKAKAAIRSGDKGPKNKDSVRQIPVLVSGVPGLHERLGQLKKLAGEEGKLFFHFIPNKYGMHGGAFSTRMNRRIDEVLGPDRRLVLESLRNTAAPTMRRAGVDPDERRVFMGHAPVDIHSAHYDRLHADDLVQASTAVANMVGDALRGVDFPRLDFVYSKQRRHLKSFNEVAKAPVKQSQASREVNASTEQNASRLDDGQHNWHSNIADGLDEQFSRNQAISAPDIATPRVTRQGIMNILGDARCSAERFESVPKRVKNQAPILNAAAILGPHMSAPPSRKIPAAIAKPVSPQKREQPIVIGDTPSINITQEADALQLGMNGDCSIRRFGLDPGDDTVACDGNQRSIFAVEHYIPNPKLTQLFEPRAGEKPQNWNPYRSLTSPSNFSPIGCVDAGREDSRKVLFTEWQARQSRIAARYWHPPGYIVGQLACVHRRLQDGGQMPEPLDDGRGRKASRNEMVAIRSDIAASELLHRHADNLVKRRGRQFELGDRTHQSRRGQVTPILKQTEHCLVGT